MSMVILLQGRLYLYVGTFNQTLIYRFLERFAHCQICTGGKKVGCYKDKSEGKCHILFEFHID